MTSMRRLFIALFSLIFVTSVNVANPTATKYSAKDCSGSLKPYPSPEKVYEYADSLTPVYISHIGRHGSRYPAGPAHSKALLAALHKADSAKTITKLGSRLLEITQHVVNTSNGRWGALDSLGMAEQRGIASRMYQKFPKLFKDTRVNAVSSYSPRSMMSMYSFTHQLDRLNNHIEVVASTGRQNSKLMRPFDVSEEYKTFYAEESWKEPYEQYFNQTVPTTAIERVLGKDFPYDGTDPKDLALYEYYVIAGLNAISIEIDPLKFFTIEEYNALWSTFNLRQYLQRAASTVSTVPAEIASDLVLDIIFRTDNFIEGKNPATVDLRFGHAETLFPLFSLLRLPGCYYLTNYFDTVGMHWRDFATVPMSANIQFILFKSKKGYYHVRVDLNEAPIKLIPNDDRTIIPWSEARNYMTRCLPLIYQP